MAGGSLGTLTLDLVAKTGGFVNGLDKASREARKKSQDISAEAAKIGTAFAAAGVAMASVAAAGVATLAVKGLQAVDTLDEMAEKAGTSVQSIQSLQLAFGEAGIDADQTQNAVKKLTVAIGDAQAGNKTAQATFDKLGLSVSELSKMDADERFAAIGDALVGYGNAADKASIASDLFGAKIGPDLAAALSQGGGSIRQASSDLEAMGLALSDIDTAKVSNAMNSFGRTGMVVDAVSQKLAVELAPLVDAISKSFLEAGKEGAGFGGMVQSAVQATIKTLAFLANAIDGIKRIGVLVADSLVYGFALVQDTFYKMARGIMATLDAIPGVDLTANVVALEEKIRGAQGVMKEAASDMRRQFEEPLAGDVFLKYAEDAKKASEEAAKATVAAREEAEKAAAKAAAKAPVAAREAARGGEAGVGVLTPKDDGGASNNAAKLAEKKAALEEEIQLELWAEGEKQAQKDAKIREGLANELALMDDQFKSQDQLLADKLSRDMQAIAEAREFGLISKEEADARELEMLVAHEGELYESEKAAADALDALDKASRDSKISDTQEALGTISSLMSSGSKKLFEIGKVAAIADAGISMYQGIMKAWALGPILGPIMAPLVAVAGMANIAKIKSTKFGGGAASSPAASVGAAASVPTAAAEAAPAQTQRPHVTVVGDVFTRESLIQMLNSAFKDGYTLSGAPV